MINKVYVGIIVGGTFLVVIGLLWYILHKTSTKEDEKIGRNASIQDPLLSNDKEGSTNTSIKKSIDGSGAYEMLNT